MKASDLLVRCLEEEGIEYIFGVPGEENADFMMSLEKSDRIRFILTRDGWSVSHIAASQSTRPSPLHAGQVSWNVVVSALRMNDDLSGRRSSASARWASTRNVTTTDLALATAPILRLRM